MTVRQWLCVFGFHSYSWEWVRGNTRVQVYACRLCGFINTDKSYGGDR